MLDKNNDALCCGIAENGATHVLRFFIGNEFTFSYNMEKLMNSKSYQNLMSRQTCPDFVGVGVVSRSKVQSLGIQVIGSYKFTQVFFIVMSKIEGCNLDAMLKEIKYIEVCESLNKNGLGFVDWEHADSEEQPLYSLDFDQCFSWLSLPEGKEPWDFIMHRALASLLMHYGKDEDICRFIKCTLGQHENCARIEYYATAFSKKIDDYSTLLKNVKKLMPKTHGILEDYKKNLL